jgi:hypothetical protein
MQKRLKRCLDDIDSSEDVVRIKKMPKRVGENPENMQRKDSDSEMDKAIESDDSSK